MKVDHVPCGPAANESERLALQTLLDKLRPLGLPQRWILLSNVAHSLNVAGVSDEIDLVTISSTGVQVIEIKHWDRSFLKANQQVVQAEAVKLNDKVKKIVAKVRRVRPDYQFIAGRFLLTKSIEPFGDDSRPRIEGATFFQLQEWRRLLDVDASRHLDDPEISALCRLIEPLSKVSLEGETRRLAGISNMELQTPKDQRFHRIYRGQHALRRDRVIVHLYDLSAYEGPNAYKVACREFDVLQRMQKSPWLPRMMDSFQDVPGYPGELCYFSVVDPCAPKLADRALDGDWDYDERMRFAGKSLAALAELHSYDIGDGSSVIHRNITPGTILVQANGLPLFTGLHWAKTGGAVTVSPGSQVLPDAIAFVAPEVRQSGLAVADQRSDVYSLCASLRLAFQGQNHVKAAEVMDLLEQGMHEEPAKRADLTLLQEYFAEIIGRPASKLIPHARYWSEGLLVPFHGQQYRIVGRLGSGSFGTTFKVVAEDPVTGEQRGSYAAKVIFDRESGERALVAYRRARHATSAPHLSVIFEPAQAWEPNSFVALMKWIDGEPLKEVTGLVGLLAEEIGEPDARLLLVRWLVDLCEALSDLHRLGLVHGDISPKNILQSKGEVTLTDYDLLLLAGEPRWSRGTPTYCPTTATVGSPACLADDVFGLAASMFHVVFDRDPFWFGGRFMPERGLNWEGICREDWGVVAQFLERATSPAAASRFTNAMEALAWLQSATQDKRSEATLDSQAASAAQAVQSSPPEPDTGPIAAEPVLTPREVPWLKEILRAYPGSLYGNVETRGLDSRFARETYVETGLEARLVDAIRTRQVRLIVLSGNAGDGKTALLQYLANEVSCGYPQSAQRVWQARLPDGLVIRANLDGSAAYRGRSSDDLLDEFFKPFQQGPPTEDIVHLLAINDGRLLEWIEGYVQRNGGETALTAWLWDALADRLLPQTGHIRVIDLNMRSLVGGVDVATGSFSTPFLDGLLNKMLGGSHAETTWQPCRTCCAKDRCTAYRSVRVLTGIRPQDTAGANTAQQVRERLWTALQAVHQRGEVHITTRELRGVLSYLFFGTQYCTDLHNDPDLPFSGYYDRAFDPLSPYRQGDVLRELGRLDPGLEAYPQIDRHLFARAIIPASAIGKEGAIGTLGSARRRAYFEWSDEQFRELEQQPDTITLARGRHLRLFRDAALASEEELRRLCMDVCQGISRLESLPAVVLRRPGVVPLKIIPRTPVETAFWVDKPLARFSLRPESFAAIPGMETLHRYLLLSYHYRDGREEVLRLNTELFHLLLELRAGYQLTDSSSDDTFANLAIFTERLAQEDERDVYAWNPTTENLVFRVSAISTEGQQRIKLVREATGD